MYLCQSVGLHDAADSLSVSSGSAASQSLFLNFPRFSLIYKIVGRLFLYNVVLITIHLCSLTLFSAYD